MDNKIGLEILWTTRLVNIMKSGWQLVINGVLRADTKANTV